MLLAESGTRDGLDLLGNSDKNDSEEMKKSPRKEDSPDGDDALQASLDQHFADIDRKAGTNSNAISVLMKYFLVH